MNAAYRWFLALAAVAAAAAIVPSTPSAAVAQAPVPNPDPWKVTLTQTLNPLAVGFCAAVHLTVFEGAGIEVPRNPTGFRVTMADFDMAAIGVLGHQIDPFHFEVCACQGGSPGTVATVTATYPAQSLGAPARVPGVAFQRTTTFVLSEKKGLINPPPCMAAGGSAPGAAPAGAAAPAPAAPPTAVALPPVAAVVAAPPAPVSTPPGEAAAAGGTAVGTAIPGAAASSVPVKTAVFVAAPVTVTLALSANGSWNEYVPAPVTETLTLTVTGSWNEYVAAPKTVTFGLSATGSWIEPPPKP